MKIHCPKCASSNTEDNGDQLTCNDCGHSFGRSDGLVALEDLSDLTLDQAGELAKALNHPVRKAILAHLMQHGEMSPNGLSKALNVPLGNTSYHMKVLYEAEPPYVKMTRTKQRRGAVEHFYAVAEGLVAERV